LIKWFGTTYRLHPLFIMLMVMAVFTDYFIELITLFAIVFIHELGHVVVSKSFGWRVTEVQILPFGGVAKVEESGNVPAWEELWVALAGPLQNVWMAVFAYGMAQFGWQQSAWWLYFMYANLFIGGFNLLPILPLDGGKMLVSLLSYRVSYLNVLRMCAYISLLFSIVIVCFVLIYYGKYGRLQFNLLGIGLFLFYANWHDYRNIPYQFRRFLMSRNRRVLENRTDGPGALPLIVSEKRSISAIVQQFQRERYHLIFVVNSQGAIYEVLTEQHLIQAFLIEYKSNRAVSELIM